MLASFCPLLWSKTLKKIHYFCWVKEGENENGREKKYNGGEKICIDLKSKVKLNKIFNLDLKITSCLSELILTLASSAATVTVRIMMQLPLPASDSCWQASIKLYLRLLARLDLARLVRSLATWAHNLHALAKAELPLAEPLEIALILLANGFTKSKSYVVLYKWWVRAFQLLSHVTKVSKDLSMTQHQCKPNIQNIWKCWLVWKII